MHSLAINQQTHGWFASPPRMQRPQKRIFDPHDPRAGTVCHGLAPRGIFGMSPNGDLVGRFGFEQAQIPAREFENAADTSLAQKTGVKIGKPPRRRCRGGLGIVVGLCQGR